MDILFCFITIFVHLFTNISFIFVNLFHVHFLYFYRMDKHAFKTLVYSWMPFLLLAFTCILSDGSIIPHVIEDPLTGKSSNTNCFTLVQAISYSWSVIKWIEKFKRFVWSIGRIYVMSTELLGWFIDRKKQQQYKLLHSCASNFLFLKFHKMNRKIQNIVLVQW